MAEHFGVSPELLRMRKNLTGIMRQLGRARVFPQRKEIRCKAADPNGVYRGPSIRAAASV